MSMILCPECRNECSALAPICPNCGHPFAPAVVPTPVPQQPRVVIREVPQSDNGGFKPWMLAPLIIVGAIIAFGIILFTRDNNDTANNNANIRIEETRTTRTTVANNDVVSTTIPSTSSGTTISRTVETSVPSSSSVTTTTLPPTTTTLPPATSTTSTSSATTANQPLSDKGTVAITATVASKTGTKQTVKKEKFYLLDDDLETILSKAGIERTGSDYASTCGASLIDSTMRDTLQKCNAAIKPHILYSTLSDSSGKASFKDVKPDDYHIYGVTKIGDSYAIWNTSINVNAGENVIKLDGNVTPVSSESIGTYND